MPLCSVDPQQKNVLRTKLTPKGARKPRLPDILQAIVLRQQLGELSTMFRTLQMSFVAENLDAACREIDRVWEEDDFIYTSS